MSSGIDRCPGRASGRSAAAAARNGIIAGLLLGAPPTAHAAVAPQIQTTLTRPSIDGPPAPLRRAGGRLVLGPEFLAPLGENGTLALPDVQSETSIAATGSYVVVGFNDFRGFDSVPFTSGSGVIYSSDGGATFSDGGQLPAPAGAQVLGDPVVAAYQPPVGPPVFYYSSIYFPAAGGVSLCVHRSTTGGATWDGPFEVTSATSLTDALEDKPWCTVDPESGRLFVAWTRFPSSGSITMRVTYSDDGGAHWSTATTIGTSGQGAVIACDPNGPDVYVAWQGGGGSGSYIGFARSPDNGGSWNSATSLSPLFNEMIPPYGFDRYNSFPSMTVNPSDGGIELVYAASANNTPAGDFGDIYYRRSTNHGQNFSAAVALNAFAGTDRAQTFPTISAASNGRIDVFWYDQSAGSGVSVLTDLFYTFSNNLGVNWSSPVPVTPSPFDVEVGNNYGAPHQGDYIDATSGGAARSGFAWFGDPSPFGSSADAFAATVSSPMEVAALRVRPGSWSLVDHGCGADDGVLVAGEAGDLTLPLENFGRTALGSIVGTLSALSPAVSVAGGGQPYPALAAGAAAASGSPFEIRLDDDYPCGTPAKFRLDITAAGVAPTYVEFSIPTGVVESQTTLLSENFDGVSPPSLPAGWTNANGCSCVPNNWVTTTTSPASAPNAAFCADAITTTFGRLFGPTVAIPGDATFVDISFDLQHNLEQEDARTGDDAVSFGYQLDGTGGTRFASSDAIEFDHRYTHYVVRPSGSNSGDRSGWSGNSGGYQHVRVRIPGLAGHTVTPRFDLTTDSNTGVTGAWIDNVVIKSLHLGCGACTRVAVGEALPGPVLALAGANPFRAGIGLRYTLTERGPVRIDVYSITGERVRALVDGVLEAGTYDTRFELGGGGLRRLRPGLYLARMTAGGQARTLRLVALQ